MRGRKPDSPALKLLKAARNGKLSMSPKTPRCPFPLRGEALGEWSRFAPILASSGRLTDVTAPAFALYCDAVAQWLAASKDVAENGLISIGDSGAVRANPSIAIASANAATMLKVLKSFGCTPASNARLGLPSADGKTNPLTKFIGGPKQRK
jgi:P27 family predicted phage terminase small subunit